MTNYDISDIKIEKHFVRTMYSCYADILFITFPFLLAGLIRTWNNEGFDILKHPDLSIAALILGGMSLGKLILAIISDTNLSVYKVRFVFIISLILFCIIGPSLVLLIKILSEQDVPQSVAIIQPLLLLSSIVLYSASININFIMTKIFNKAR